MTAGWFKPVLLVPANLVTGMPPDLLEALLAHELAHVRRHDYLVNLLQFAAEILLFFIPRSGGCRGASASSANASRTTWPPRLSVNRAGWRLP